MFRPFFFPIKTLVLLFFFLGFATPHVDAAVIYVKHDAAGSSTGTSWNDAYTDLSEAINQTTAGNVIWVARGTYLPTGHPNGGTEPLERHFSLKNNVAIYGGFSGTEDPATFDLADRDFANNDTILSGLYPGNPPLTPPYKIYHVFYHPDGTGLDETAVIDGCTISGGDADKDVGWQHRRGGGMFNGNCHPTVRNCTFSGNSAEEMGGGIYNEEGSPDVVNCTFHDNAAVDGAGMRNAYSQATIVNCTFFQNSAATSGGGIYNAYLGPVIRNCIIYGNAAGNLYDAEGAAANVSYSLIEGGWPGDGNIDEDPLLETLADNGGATRTCAIPVNSPAYAIPKDAGTEAWNNAPDTDQRSLARASGGLRAMGAYEALRSALPAILLLLIMSE